MAASEVERIHERIDSLASKIDALNEKVTQALTRCEPCWPRGDTPHLATRVYALEQDRAMRTRLFWALLTGIPTLIAGIVGAAVNWWRS